MTKVVSFVVRFFGCVHYYLVYEKSESLWISVYIKLNENVEKIRHLMYANAFENEMVLFFGNNGNGDKYLLELDNVKQSK